MGETSVDEGNDPSNHSVIFKYRKELLIKVAPESATPDLIVKKVKTVLNELKHHEGECMRHAWKNRLLRNTAVIRLYLFYPYQKH